jgi:hypothetical protein
LPLQRWSRGCRHELLDAIDERRERLDVARRPERSPVVPGAAPEEHSILGGDYAGEVLPHDVIEVGNKLVRPLGHTIER